MARAPYRPDLKGQQKAAFREANPPAYGRTQGIASSVRQIGFIEKRAAAIKEKVRAHFRKYEETWVAKESIAIWKRHAALGKDYQAPANARALHATDAIMIEARRNVRARANHRLTRINQIKNRMANAVIRNRDATENPRLTVKNAKLSKIFKKRSMKQ